MIYQIGIEDIEPNHWVAWVFNLPGCFSKATTRDKALANTPTVITNYYNWLSRHNHQTDLLPEKIEINITESFDSFISEEDYIVNACFEHDRRPLTEHDIKNTLTLLDYTHNDLFELIRRIPSDQFDKPIPGEVQISVNGILRHIATAEWWYFDRLNLAFNREEFPDKVFSMLEKSRDHTRRTLPQLVGSTQIIRRVGEYWSPRKVIRRTLWHERAHTAQIIRYLEQ